MVNSYNAPVLENNPDLDEVYAYTKAKHRSGSRLLALWHEFSLFWKLRRERFELIIHANPTPHPRTEKLIHFLKPGNSLGVVQSQQNSGPYSLALTEKDIVSGHHVERVFSLLRPLGITGAPGPMTLISQSQTQIKTIGIHLSSRKPCNRWPQKKYVELALALLKADYHLRIFWAPGSQTNKLHPGDDELANAVIEALPEGAELVPTQTLKELIDGLASCQSAIVPDGGALHIAAALGKPCVALFGCTDPQQWGPWGKQHQILLGKDEASTISVNQITSTIEEINPQ